MNNKKLNKTWIKLWKVPLGALALYLICYMLLKIVGYDAANVEAIIIGILMGSLAGYFLRWRKYHIIYDYTISDHMLTLFLTNPFKQASQISFEFDGIKKYKYISKGIWKDHDRIWLHFEDRVQEYLSDCENIDRELEKILSRI